MELDEYFLGRWIGPGGPIAWPPQSPDLNPQDYYLWGYLNGIIYNSEVNTGEELLERINLVANMLR